MCSVTAIAVIGLVTSAAATATSAHASRQQAKATNYANRYTAEVAENNAQVAEWQADDASQRGEEEATRARIRRGSLIGAQRAAFAGSGVTVDVGSPLIVTESTDALGEMDAMTIKHNAALEAWAYRNEARGFEAQAELSRKNKRSPALAMTSSLLSGVSQMSGQFAGMYGAGMFGGGKE